MKARRLLLFITMVLSLNRLSGQEFSDRDLLNIQYFTLFNISTAYQEELNFISNTSSTAAEIEAKIDLLVNGSKRIFESSEILLEDNIDPKINQHSEFKRDVAILSYLRDLDLNYEKTRSQSIVFSNFEISEVGYKTYPYVLLKYDSKFNSEHKHNKYQFYRTNTRVAEFRIDRSYNDEIKVYITSIYYYDPKVEFKVNKNAMQLFEGKDPNDILALIEDEKVKIEVDKRDKEKLAKAEKEYENSMEKASEALANYDLQTAKREANYAASKLSDRKDHVIVLEKIDEIEKARIREEEEKKARKDDEFNRQVQEVRSLFVSRQFTKATEAANKLKDEFPARGKNEWPSDINLEEINKVKALLNSIEYRIEEEVFENVIDELSDAIEKNPKIPELYEKRARLYSENDDYKRARLDIKKALVLNPKYIKGRETEGDIFARYNQLPQAYVAYREVLEMDRNNSNLYAKLANTKLEMGDLKIAKRDINRGIELDDQNPQLHYVSGLILKQEENLIGAIDEFTKAIELLADNDSKKGSYYFHRGQIKELLNGLPIAEEDYRKSLELGGMDNNEKRFLYKKGKEEYNKAVEHLTELNKKIKLVKEDSRESIDEFWVQDKSNMIIKLCDQSLAYYFKLPHPYYLKGKLYFTQKDYQQAKDNFQQAIYYNYKHIDSSNYYYAICALNTGDEEMALKSFEKAQQLNLLIAHLGKGKLFYQQRKLVEAEGELTEYANKEESKEAHFLIGKIYFEEYGRYTRAMDEFSKAIKIDNEYAIAYHYRALAQEKKDGNKVIAIISDLERALKDISVQSDSIYNMLGDHQVRYTNLKEAVRSYRKSLAENRKQLGIYYKISDTYARIMPSQYENAINSLKEAATIWPNIKDEEYHVKIAMYYFLLNEFDKALEHADLSIGVKNNARAHVVKAMSYMDKKEEEKTFEALETAFEMKELKWEDMKKYNYLKYLTRIRGSDRWKALKAKYLE